MSIGVSAPRRYFYSMALSRRVEHEWLTRICFIDYDREIALIVERADQASGAREIIAVGTLIKLRCGEAAEFAILVGDRYQHCGIGTELLRRLLQIGRDEQIGTIVADILVENSAMKQVCRKLGFRLHSRYDGVVKAELTL
jgi:acetyltransferase